MTGPKTIITAKIVSITVPDIAKNFSVSQNIQGTKLLD